MLALFGAPPPARNPTHPPHLPLPTCMCWHCASDDFPLPLLSLSSPLRVRGARRPASEAAATAVAATTTTTTMTAEVSVGVGVSTRARQTAAATGGGVDVATCRRRHKWSVVSGQWSVCVRSRRARDARVTREWHPRNTTLRGPERTGPDRTALDSTALDSTALDSTALAGPDRTGGRRSAVGGRGRRRRRRRGVWTAGRRRSGAVVAMACGVLVVK